MSEAIYKIREKTIKEIADAIRAKAGKTDLINPLDMAEEILLLQAGNVDFTKQTVTEENVEVGYTFYNKYGLLSTGTGGLNFSIIGSTTEPTNPKENMIWVNTNINIGEYQFSTIEPMARIDGTGFQIGDIWIKTGASKLTQFNILKKNGVTLNPSACYQWNNGIWESIESKIYINNTWIDIIGTLLDGTKGVENWTLSKSGTGRIEITENGIMTTQTTSNSDTVNGFATYKELINFNNVNSVIVTTIKNKNKQTTTRIRVLNGSTEIATITNTTYNNNTNYTNHEYNTVLDTSGINGYYTLEIRNHVGGYYTTDGNLTTTKVQLL